MTPPRESSFAGRSIDRPRHTGGFFLQKKGRSGPGHDLSPSLKTKYSQQIATGGLQLGAGCSPCLSVGSQAPGSQTLSTLALFDRDRDPLPASPTFIQFYQDTWKINLLLRHKANLSGGGGGVKGGCCKGNTKCPQWWDPPRFPGVRARIGLVPVAAGT